jgi:SAM-dependent methyltransferase
VVADVGCGPGYFTRRLARAVPAGVVYAVDVEPRQLDRLNAHLRDDGLVNVVPVLATAADPHLPPGRLDMILVVDTYHHFDNRAQYLQTLKRGLKPAGRLVLIDYRKEPLPVGPPVAHKFAREQELSETESAGFQLIDEPTFLPYQYFLIFTPRVVDR